MNQQVAGRNIILADWRTGGLADWRTGGLADWRTGGLAIEYAVSGRG
jgi:hypothetical protein